MPEINYLEHVPDEYIDDPGFETGLKTKFINTGNAEEGRDDP